MLAATVALFFAPTILREAGTAAGITFFWQLSIGLLSGKSLVIVVPLFGNMLGRPATSARTARLERPGMGALCSLALKLTLECSHDPSDAGSGIDLFWIPNMTGNAYFSTNLLLAYAAYFVGTASPGPSNLAIMSIAASHGRKAALTFALGVISGSMFWAMVATLGVSAALIAYSQFIIAVKIFGGLYLLWLAFKSGRNALATAAASVLKVERTPTLTSVYSRGAMLHLTNPKAILVWVSIVALSSNTTGSAHSAVIAGCAAIGCVVFGGYAVLFSTDSARRMYVRTRRALEGCLALVFGIAGIRLLASRI